MASRAAACSSHAPPSGSQPQDTRASTQPPSQDLDGSRSVDVWAWVQFQDPVLSINPFVYCPRLYLLLCFSLPLLALRPCPKRTLLSIPVRLWSPPYCPDTKSTEKGAQKGAFLSSSTTSLGTLLTGKGLACSGTAVVLVRSCPAALQGTQL